MSAAITLYGLKTCDTCRKARKWLDQHGVDYRFHDVRDDGLARETLDRWVSATGWKPLLNTRSRTWRTLDAKQREALHENGAVTLMLEKPTLVKRPVLEHEAGVLVGFDRDAYLARFAS